jgi:hypothetical protein
MRIEASTRRQAAAFGVLPPAFARKCKRIPCRRSFRMTTGGFRGGRADCNQDWRPMEKRREVSHVPTSTGGGWRKPARDDSEGSRPGACAVTELRWPHRATDWELALRHGEGLVAGATRRRHRRVGAGSAARPSSWSSLAPACQGRRIGHRLMSALLTSRRLHRAAVRHARGGSVQRLGLFGRQCDGTRAGAFRQPRSHRRRLATAACGRRHDALWTSNARAACRGADHRSLAQVRRPSCSTARESLVARHRLCGHVIGPVIAGSVTGATLIAHLSDWVPFHAHRHQFRQQAVEWSGWACCVDAPAR